MALRVLPVERHLPAGRGRVRRLELGRAAGLGAGAGLRRQLRHGRGLRHHRPRLRQQGAGPELRDVNVICSLRR